MNDPKTARVGTDVAEAARAASADVAPDTVRARGSRRRGQWIVQPRGAARIDASVDDERVAARGGGDFGRPRRRGRVWIPLVAVVAAVLLVVGLTVISGSSPRSGPTAAAAARTSATDTGAASGAILPLTAVPASPSSASPPPNATPTAVVSVHATAGSAVGTAAAKAAAKGSALPKLIGSWQLNDATGTTAVDSVAHHNGVCANITWVGAAAEFNGTSSEITAPGPVVDTSPGRSFTVAAWVYLWSTSAFATAVSQSGSVNSGFYLEYSGADNRWAFARQSSDSNTTTPYRALSSAAPALNTWTPLVGVFDGTTDELFLYVNGQLQGAATDPSPFATHGSFNIGRSIAGGGYGAWFPGLIGGVEVFDQALTNAQIQALGTYK